MIEITIAPSAAWINRPRPPTTAASERVVIRKGGLGSNLLVLGAAELPFEALIDAPSSYLLAAG